MACIQIAKRVWYMAQTFGTIRSRTASLAVWAPESTDLIKLQ